MGLQYGDFPVRPPAKPILGVRPEHLTLAREAGKAPELQSGAPDRVRGHPAPARVDLIEPLGSSMDVYLTTQPGQRLVARVNATSACRPGQSVDLTVSAAQAHLFEPGAYGSNLTAARDASAS